MNRLIIYLIRKKFRLKRGERFIFANQKGKCTYYFDKNGLIKVLRNQNQVLSGVALNWLLDDNCKIEKICQ